MSNLKNLIRKEVVVHAAGTTYRGMLIEVGENEVLLKASTGWISVPMSKVNQITAYHRDQTLPANRFVDQSFYDPDND